MAECPAAKLSLECVLLKFIEEAGFVRTTCLILSTQAQAFLLAGRISVIGRWNTCFAVNPSKLIFTSMRRFEVARRNCLRIWSPSTDLCNKNPKSWLPPREGFVPSRDPN